MKYKSEVKSLMVLDNLGFKNRSEKTKILSMFLKLNHQK